ncbi:crossover junction endodeoxyribonuclease RuvC [Ferrimicrobium sp.]|uniref:crossover junction endodeoxyribonuclease RuvC n=1 Tax=Ferrimicrobium sp. TaxID=2926050 RepID=UPI00262C8801|nr:crossover junction endodeoxyribonuclease RuvC [Ferrimicrobium sp.]
MTVVLGIDPGLKRVGYSVLEATQAGIGLRCAGLITTAPEVSLGDRLSDIFGSIDELIREYRPSQMVLERILFAKNVTSALLVAQAVGVIKLAGAQHGLEASEIGANQVKLALSGDGHASKAQMKKMVVLLLGLKRAPEPADVSDAIAIAYAHLSGNWSRG